MSTYRFRLDPVRRLRQAERDELRGQLADAYRAAEVIEGERRQVLSELEELRRRQQGLTAERHMNVTRLLDNQRYELLLQSQSASLADKLRLVEQEVERRRELVAQADRQVRTLDKLEDRHRAAHKLDWQRAEMKQMDETALMGRSRKPDGGDQR